MLSLLISISSFAQDKREQMRDRIQAQKVAFITNELDLSSEESQKFWPIYNEYQKEAESNRPDDSFRKASRDMTDAEAQEMLDQNIIMQQKNLDLRKKYIDRFKSAIPTRKIALLFYAEHQFKKNVLDSLGKRMKKRKNKRN